MDVECQSNEGKRPLIEMGRLGDYETNGDASLSLCETAIM